MRADFAALIIVCAVLCTIVSGASYGRARRQTYYYPDEFRKYAHTHSGTKVSHGTVGRFAPQDWPAWYTRMIFRWNGETRHAPYHPNDVRYAAYEQSRIQNANHRYVPIEARRRV